MDIVIIGRGNVGSALQSGLSRIGHQVRALGRAEDVTEAVTTAEVVVFAVPFGEVQNVAGQLGSAVNGKVVIDATNALTPSMELAVDTRTTSGAEELQKALPAAKVVKAFNTAFASAMATGEISGEKLAGLVAGDDADAKAQVLSMVEAIGFDPIDAGPLSAARLLEPLAVLNIKLGFVQGYGPVSGFRLVH
ncbi:NAD(P)-binding domain-containing protein [Sphingomonas sp. BN140010]|uniref:NAD(P)-binding domain-containing protein n=1 Tax=Sphingomonas arvum TaxID=2992113 RepID=A0ABT3JC48_9SPHN|nr:NAD(P)-binding domain-containing protein [Sphingomonas sp. BN140010]MCW3796489.1 NAD(P)-binding domain-containing protein [Sphingomonas sp. BN140010]